MIKAYSFILFLIITCNSYGQSYHPLIGESNLWYVLLMPEGYYTDVYATKGDTLVNNKSYKILGFEETANVFAFIREDTSTRKIFAIPNSYKDTSEIVYYDFSLDENDSIFLYDFDYDTLGWYHVDSTRYVNTLDGLRKAIYLKGAKDEHGHYRFPVWIEGVGTTGNPVYRGYTPGIMNLGELSCFFINGTKVYQSKYSSEIDTCYIFTSGIYGRDDNEDIMIYPNPASYRLNLRISRANDYIVTVFDFYGKQLSVLENPESIDLRNLSEGTYLLKIQTEESIAVKKFLIIR